MKKERKKKKNWPRMATTAMFTFVPMAYTTSLIFFLIGMLFLTTADEIGG